MRASTLPLRCVLLAVTLAASTLLCAQPYGYSINSRGDFNDNARVFALWRINLGDGDAEYIGWTGRGDFIDIEGLAFSPDERLFGADDNMNTLVRIGTNTGNAIAVGGTVGNTGIPIGTNMDFGMTFTCEGELLVSSAATSELFRADVDSGALERIGDMGVQIVDLATIGDVIYGIGLGTDRNGSPVAPNLYRVDPASGRVELVGALGEQARPYNQAGLAADADGQLWAITDRNRVFGDSDTEARPSDILRIDPDTGRAVRVAETIVGIESLAITPPGECESDNGDGRDQPPGFDIDAEHVPVMSGAGRWLMVVLLAGLALWRLRPLQS
jgi:sugar lactone lactonase YvrE